MPRACLQSPQPLTASFNPPDLPAFDTPVGAGGCARVLNRKLRAHSHSPGEAGRRRALQACLRRGRWAPHHSPLSLDLDAFVPRTKPGGSAVLRPASLSSGRDGSLGLRVDCIPSMGPGIPGWPQKLPTTPGCEAVVGEQTWVQIPQLTHRETWASVLTALSLSS